MDRPKLQPRLIVIEGKDKGKAISLRNGTSIVGRSKADVIIEDPRISRSHVALHFDEKAGTVSFTDLKSLNGTLLNGQPAESGELKDGDKLQLGNTLFDCQLRVDAWEASLSISIRPPEPSAPPGRTKPENKKATRVNGSEDSPEKNKNEVNPIEAGQLQKIREMYATFPKRIRLWVWIGLLVGFVFWGMPAKDRVSSNWAKVESLEKAGKPDEAFSMVETLTKENPGDSKLQWKAGGYFEKQGRFDLAMNAYNNAANGPHPEPLAVVRLVSLLLRSGRTDAANQMMAKLDQVIKEGPHSKEFFIEAAQMFIENKQLTHSPEKAMILARALQTEFAADSSIGYKLEAQILFQNKRNKEALAVIETGLGVVPTDEWLLENQAFAKLSMRDLNGAEAVVKKWLEHSPENTKALLVMAYLRFNEKDFNGALPYAQSILQLKQNEPANAHYKEALFLTGEIYWNQGQSREAVTFLKQACESGYEAGCKHQALAQPADRATATPADRSPQSRHKR